MFRDYQVIFLSDATGTFHYPDVGQGAMSAEQVHQATLTILAFSTADVMTAEELRYRVQGSRGVTKAARTISLAILDNLAADFGVKVAPVNVALQLVF